MFPLLSIVAEALGVWTVLELAAVTMAPVVRPEIVPLTVDHCGLAEAPWVCRNCPFVPGERALQEEAPRIRIVPCVEEMVSSIADMVWHVGSAPVFPPRTDPVAHTATVVGAPAWARTTP